ncbi:MULTISPECIES: DEAD/DEAH box helicase [Erysipelotrichaceae]|nr:DEAD/DEAH box helicase [Absiella sp. AM27-20]RHU07237.1 ATP-dependent helicase [Absiella sp. AM27-20]
MNKINFMPHQTDVLKATEECERCAYYLDMGLGKTFVGAEKLMRMKKSMNLLICQKSKIEDWIEHFKKYYSDFPYCISVFNLTNKKELQQFMNAQKSLEPNFIYDEWTEQSYMQESLDPCQYIGVINYDLAFRRKQLLELRDFTLMLDESSIIQNDKTKRTKFILSLNSKNVILLSGTPTSGKYENLWSQCHMLGWNISLRAFQTQYVNWQTIDVGGFPQKIVDKVNPYKNIERLKQKMRDHGAIFMKTEEVIDLPEQIYIDISLKKTKEYMKFMRKHLVQLTNEKNELIELIGDTTLTKKLYARQLCGAYCKEKLAAFEDLVNSTQDRLIVFYNFNIELEALKNICQKLERPISEVNGKIKSLSAYENSSNSVTLVQYQAGAMGLNLQKANKIIYFTLTERSELFEQSKKRIHRIGQKNTCFYYIMTCKRSVEEMIYENLKKRKDYTDDLFKEYEETEDE